MWCIIFGALHISLDSSFQLKQGAYNFFLCLSEYRDCVELLVQVDCLGAWAKLPQQHMSVNTTGEQFQKCGKTWLDLQQQGVVQKWSNFLRMRVTFKMRHTPDHCEWNHIFVTCTRLKDFCASQRYIRCTAAVRWLSFCLSRWGFWNCCTINLEMSPRRVILTTLNLIGTFCTAHSMLLPLLSNAQTVLQMKKTLFLDTGQRSEKYRKWKCRVLIFTFRVSCKQAYVKPWFSTYNLFRTEEVHSILSVAHKLFVWCQSFSPF